MLEQCVFGFKTVLFAQRKKQEYWGTDTLKHVVLDSHSDTFIPLFVS